MAMAAKDIYSSILILSLCLIFVNFFLCVREQVVEQYLNYLSIIKCRAENTIKEYRTDILMFFSFLSMARSRLANIDDFSWVDIDFIKSIKLSDMYSFITYCKEQLHSSSGTRARKIVSLR